MFIWIVDTRIQFVLYASWSNDGGMLPKPNIAEITRCVHVCSCWVFLFFFCGGEEWGGVWRIMEESSENQIWTRLHVTYVYGFFSPGDKSLIKRAQYLRENHYKLVLSHWNKIPLHFKGLCHKMDGLMLSTIIRPRLGCSISFIYFCSCGTVALMVVVQCSDICQKTVPQLIFLNKIESRKKPRLILYKMWRHSKFHSICYLLTKYILYAETLGFWEYIEALGLHFWKSKYITV